MTALRSALIVNAAAAGFADAAASGADAWIVGGERLEAFAPPEGVRIYVSAPPFDAPGALDALDMATAAGVHGFALRLAEGGTDVQRLAARLAVIEARRGLSDGALRILAFAAETPASALAFDTYRNASARLDGLVFTTDPLRRRLSPAGRPAAAPLRLVRELLLIAARAAGVAALDAPFADLADLAGLRAEAVAARDDGFDGKLALDARQVYVLNDVFG